MAFNALQAVIGVTGFHSTRGDVSVYGEQLIRIDLPNAADEKSLELMRKDLEMLQKILNDSPRTILDIQNAVLKNDFPTANRLAAEVGLTEENMIANGGGMWGYILVAAVVIAAYAAFSGPGEEPPPPPPPPPPPNGGVDGGTDGGLPPGGVPR